MGWDTCRWRGRGSRYHHATTCSLIPLPGGDLSAVQHRKLGRAFIPDFLYQTNRVWFSFWISREKLVVLAPASASTPHMGTSHTPFNPARHHLSPHLGGNFWLSRCLFKIKMTFSLHPRLAVKCVVLISQRAASKGLFYRCFPSPAISLLSQGYGGGVRDRAIHALLPLKSHLNNHEGKQQRSANSRVGDVFICCSEICTARTANSGAYGSPPRHWHLKLSA